MKFLVATSDAYWHVMPGFAYLFNKNFGEREVDVLCYAKKRVPLPPNFTKWSAGRQDDYQWSGGLIKYLKEHDDPIVLLMLEDYYILHADCGVVSNLEAYMVEYPGIGKIDLTNDRLKFTHKSHGMWRGQSMIRSAYNAPYTFSLQAALWRRDFLLDFLDAGDNPWYTEKNASRRFKESVENGDKRIILGCAQPPMEYVNAIGGAGNKPQEWDKRKFPTDLWRELLELGYVAEN